MAQSKLLRVSYGEIYDVAVDLREASNTFGRFVGIHLKASERQSILIPAGFAHGFLTLSEWAEVTYLVDQYYSPEHCRALAWNDPQLAIDWPITDPPILSAQDQRGDFLNMADLF